MSKNSFDPLTTAVLIVDLQNDFLDPLGAYGRSGNSNPDIAALPSKVGMPGGITRFSWTYSF